MNEFDDKYTEIMQLHKTRSQRQLAWPGTEYLQHERAQQPIMLNDINGPAHSKAGFVRSLA